MEVPTMIEKKQTWAIRLQSLQLFSSDSMFLTYYPGSRPLLQHSPTRQLTHPSDEIS